MPASRSRAAAMSTLLGVAMWLGSSAWAMDPEARPVSLQSSSGQQADSAAWLPWCVFAAGVGVAAWSMARRAARLRARPQGGIQVIDRAHMGRGRALSLVRVGDRVVLVGESAQGFQRLAEFEASAHEQQATVVRRLAS